CRRSPGEAAVGLEVERLWSHIRGWPGVVLLPYVAAGFEGIGFRHRFDRCALQVFFEERKLDVFAVEDAGVGAKLHVTQRGTSAARPSAVYPRPLDQHVRWRAGALRIDRMKHLHWAGEIFGI